jgi:hypothetical protein
MGYPFRGFPFLLPRAASEWQFYCDGGLYRP